MDKRTMIVYIFNPVNISVSIGKLMDLSFTLQVTVGLVVP